MLRLAQDEDIAWLINQMLNLKQGTGWCNESDEYNQQSLQQFLQQRLHDPLSVCYVWQANNGLPAAFCGAILQRIVFPPYMLGVFEWGWYGPRREAVTCWRACTQWGKKHSAVYGCRVTASPTIHPRRINESVTWEKL